MKAMRSCLAIKLAAPLAAAALWSLSDLPPARAQVSNVSQYTDVMPTDRAYQALAKLME